ncbi:hypothetical protein PFISCL1PPCAC_25303, partial [Pristionchus fissidentatus]
TRSPSYFNQTLTVKSYMSKVLPDYGKLISNHNESIQYSVIVLKDIGTELHSEDAQKLRDIGVNVFIVDIYNGDGLGRDSRNYHIANISEIDDSGLIEAILPKSILPREYFNSKLSVLFVVDPTAGCSFHNNYAIPLMNSTMLRKTEKK